MSAAPAAHGGRERGGLRAPRDLPWQTDPNLKPDLRPSELFPEYAVPTAAPLTKDEERQLLYFLGFRQQMRDGPLYTQSSASVASFGDARRPYGHERVGKRYATKSKATVDPFLAVPMYTDRFIERKRALPDLSKQKFVKEFFPQELHATIDGDDGLVPRTRGGDGRKPLRRDDTTQSQMQALYGVFETDRTGISHTEQMQQALEALESVREEPRQGEEPKEGEEGREGEASDDEVAMTQDEDEWAIGRYTEDLDLYEDPEIDPDELEEEDGEGDYDIQQHYEDVNDDNDGRYDGGGEYDDGGENMM